MAQPHHEPAHRPSALGPRLKLRVFQLTSVMRVQVTHFQIAHLCQEPGGASARLCAAGDPRVYRLRSVHERRPLTWPPGGSQGCFRERLLSRTSVSPLLQRAFARGQDPPPPSSEGGLSDSNRHTLASLDSCLLCGHFGSTESG